MERQPRKGLSGDIPNGEKSRGDSDLSVLLKNKKGKKGAESLTAMLRLTCCSDPNKEGPPRKDNSNGIGTLVRKRKGSS